MSSRSCCTTSNAGRGTIQPCNSWITCVPCALHTPIACDFLFTGSIGLPSRASVSAQGRKRQRPCSMTCCRTPLPPMTHQNTCDLAAALLEQTDAAPAQIPELGLTDSQRGRRFPLPMFTMSSTNSTNCVAHLPSRMYRPRWIISSTTRTTRQISITTSLVCLLTTPNDERLRALIVLDTIASLSSPTSGPKLLNLCKHRDPSLADEQLREVLTALVEDHYIERRNCDDGVVYDFRWQLIKKWWKETRL